jgi:nitroreductase
MDFTTVVTTRRSIRTFAHKPVPPEVLDRVLEAGRIAPSACNFQPWRLVVVQDTITRTRLAGMAHGQHFVAKAPVVIVCCGKRYPQSYSWIGDDLYLMDVAIAIDHMALAARNEGLGTCWIGSFDDQPIKKLLAIPAEWDVIMMLIAGYPTSDDLFTTQTERLPLHQVIYRERFAST